jgi:serine protease Do
MSLIEKMRTQKLLSFTVLLFTLSIGIMIGTLVNSGVNAARDESPAADATPLAIPSPVEMSNTFSQIAKQVEPAVVNVSTTYNARPNRVQNRRGRPAPQDDEEGDSSMNDFFNRFFGGGGGNPFGGGVPNMPQQRSSATGSGVVVDRAGYILTNNHVVDKADRIQVKFPNDPTQYDAKVVGTDPDTDLAVLRVDGKKNLAVAKIGNSDAVQVGDWAIAIGSPFGFQATVTAGIISAKERDIAGESSQFQHFLQTDAAINPGNSGGPLLNIRGEVIGINTAIASRSGGFQGIGFALPINTAASVYNDIVKTGKVTRGSIGIRFSPSGTEQAAALLKSYGADEGVFIQDVAPGGPSEKAGLKAGDIIVAINGKPVKEGNDLVNTVVATPVGSSVNLTVWRDKARKNFTVVVGDLAQVFPERYGNRREATETRPEVEGVTSFGMQIENLSEQRRQTMDLTEKGGVLVSGVDPSSFADDIGLAKGDVVVSINQQPVASTADVTRIRETLKPGAAVAFRVMRQQGRNGAWASTFLAGTLPNN